MRAYVTSIGEPTTKICCEQLAKQGFDVELISGDIPWNRKYVEFINLAEANDQDCLRVDADFIVNQRITPANVAYYLKERYMVQFEYFDFYRNDITTGQPVAYSKEAIPIIRRSIMLLDKGRPEASAWRLPEINEFTLTVQTVAGMHGFFQSDNHAARHMKHKIERGQIKDYDFALADKLRKI